ncbi:hypothetical protein ACXR6G_07380 [Ancylomarina sp. YFZ004]
MKFFKVTLLILTIFSINLLLTSCDSDDDAFANITLNEGNTGDIGGDFTGNGGDNSQTFNWQNSLSTAEYNADITSSANGIFQMIVKDSEGTTVLDRSLNGSVEPDSYSGVTSEGVSGAWTVTINLTDFNGDGSFSLSEGN